MRLTGKVAIVTGAASGIGRGIARMFAEEGARVLVADVDDEGGEATVKQIRGVGGEARFAPCDVSRAADAEGVVAQAVEGWGGLDILVNNAGIVRLGSVTETTEERWDEVLRVNLKGVFLCSRAALPAMIEAGKGAIVNIASIGGLVPAEGLAAYATAKAGVVHLSRQMANDYAAHWIRVNCICPGTIDTPMHDVFYTPETKEETLAEWAETRPLQTVGAPADVAYAAVYLASDEARFVTGCVLPVDGGVTGARG